jgi:hypothetical protein
MNTRTSLIATAATLALFSAAKGQTVIDITGSTAGRSTVDSTIKALLTNETVAWYTTDGRTLTSSSGADGAIYKGGTLDVGGTATAVTIRTFWAGSATGVDYVSNQVQLNNKFLATSITPAGAQLTGANIVLAPASAETVAEFGFSDVKQTATIYQTNTLAESTDIFVIPFRFVATQTTTGISNITSQQVRAHFTSTGETDKSLFTGVLGDNGQVVYAVGRDGDSGTRITALAETGAGAAATVAQWSFTTDGSGNDVTLSDPAEEFNGGFASGGSVATILGGTGFQAIGYVGISDATSAINAGGVALNFNGVAYSTDNVKNGSYTFWSTYQMLRQQTLSGATASLFNSLKTTLIALPSSSSTIKLTDMQVTRAGDGATVYPN